VLSPDRAPDGGSMSIARRAQASNIEIAPGTGRYTEGPSGRSTAPAPGGVLADRTRPAPHPVVDSGALATSIR
jgi:hypothetical protein